MAVADTTVSTGRSGANAGPIIGLLFLVAIVGLGGWALWTADPPIDRSVIGMNGLPLALAKDDGQKVETLCRRMIKPKGDKTPALRIFPLYDNDTYRNEKVIGTSRDLRQELRRTTAFDIREKIRQAPTLIVLPKWRLGTLAQSVFHPTYLLDAEEMRIPLPGARIVAKSRRQAIAIERADPVYETFTPRGQFKQPVTLYAAQTMKIQSGGRTCAPVVWRGNDRLGQVLLARCQSGEFTYHVLSDPDLVNNHGLGVGGNVTFARAMIAGLSTGGPTYLDLNPQRTFVNERRRDNRGRSLSDLERFFTGPFSLAWIALVLLAVLALWRGAVRFGRPIVTAPDYLEASRATMIDADARVLRASGATVPLLRQHAEGRIAAVARSIFGRAGTSEELLRAVARRRPEQADALRNLVAEVTPGSIQGQPATPHPQTWLSRFDATIRDVQKEFDR